MNTNFTNINEILLERTLHYVIGDCRIAGAFLHRIKVHGNVWRQVNMMVKLSIIQAIQSERG